ncbi:MAG: DUF3570 domain-containing protein [Gammaproteobacteria bacterium]|nr:DUF3570 domain-containing protein [Gammaproteobacteria bacterium]
MQLNKKKSIAAVIATATASLMSQAIAADNNDKRWEIDTSVLYYGEQDDRIEDVSFATRIAREFEDGRQLTFGLTVDSLTGATPTGAVELNQPQTFTRPSARGQYVTAPGTLPLDDSFKDSRTAGYVSWSQPFGDNWAYSAGFSFSTEYDYQHLGVNGSVSRELNNNNTTLSAGFAYAQDEWDPEGGVPNPLSELAGVGNQSNKSNANPEKTVVDLLFGVTQVINERMIAQLNYSYSKSDDYLNDPYKFLTVLDTSGQPVSGPGGLFSYRFENRPDERTKHSLFAKLKTFIGGGALDTSYRYLTDDWGINSHTLDFRYRFNLNEQNYVEPHIRYYVQGQADFYMPNLSASLPIPVEASADYRLGDFNATTIGVKFGHKFDGGSEISARIEWYQQDGEAKLHSVSGSNADVFPDLDAVIFQLSYRFRI